jgi:hypothetical protein
MTTAELEKKSGELAIVGLNVGLPKLFDKIKKAMSMKGITFAKLIRIYAVVESAVKQIDAIVAEK